MNRFTVFRGAPVVRNLVRQLLTVRDVAELLKISTATVYALAERGDLAHVRVANAIRFSEEEIERYLSRP